MVALERLAMAVERVAVGLDDQPLRPPDEVRLQVALARGDPDGDRWAWQAVFAAQLEEGFLQLAFGEGGLVGLLQRSPQPARSEAAVGSVKHVVDGPDVEEPEDLGLLDGPLHAPIVQHLGEVQQGAGDGGAGDVVDSGGVFEAKGERPVGGDSGPGPA